MTTPHVAFVLEQTLGHVTHGQNLQSLVPRSPGIRATFLPIPYEAGERAGRIPGWSNWSVRASIRARRALRRVQRVDPIDALFVHTQVPGVLNPDIVRRIPTVVSVDATPIQYDLLGDHYGHATGSPRVENLKWRLNRASFHRAWRVVAWSEWAKESLVEHYGVDADKVAVIPPGVDTERWAAPLERKSWSDSPMRFLFVGGDLRRKGGLDLLAAFRRLRDQRPGEAELHLVTTTQIEPEPGVVVHNGLVPNSTALIELYHSAHAFCLPTLGDCLPMVLSEAGAAALPLVSTDVGAIREIVVDGATGLLVPVSSPDALCTAMSRLLDDPALTNRLGDEARRHVSERFDAGANVQQLVDLLAGVAEQAGHGSR